MSVFNIPYEERPINMSQLRKHPIQKSRKPDINDLHIHIRSSSTAISIDTYADADQTRAEQEPPESHRKYLREQDDDPHRHNDPSDGIFSPISAPHKQSPDAHLVYYIVRTGGPYVLIPFGGLPSPFSGSPAPTDGGRSRAARDGSPPRPPRRSRRSRARSDACSP